MADQRYTRIGRHVFNADKIIAFEEWSGTTRPVKIRILFEGGGAIDLDREECEPFLRMVADSWVIVDATAVYPPSAGPSGEVP